MDDSNLLTEIMERVPEWQRQMQDLLPACQDQEAVERLTNLIREIEQTRLSVVRIRETRDPPSN